jgi:hypothetical protein
LAPWMRAAWNKDKWMGTAWVRARHIGEYTYKKKAE